MGVVWLTIVCSAIGIAIGGLITWLVSKKYYKAAGNELQKEAGELKELNNLILRALEEAGFVKYNFDEQGKRIGFNIEIRPKQTVL